MSNKHPESGYRIIHAGTRRPVRHSMYSDKTVYNALYKLICNWPDADFLITDPNYVPIPASRLRP